MKISQKKGIESMTYFAILNRGIRRDLTEKVFEQRSGQRRKEATQLSGGRGFQFIHSKRREDGTPECRCRWALGRCRDESPSSILFASAF